MIPSVTASSAPGPCMTGMGLRYVARQPILDLQGRARGYELLYRHGDEAAFIGDGEQATRTMLDNLVLFGPHRFTGGEPAFINCTQQTLTSELVSVAPPGVTVLEVLETVELTSELLASCRRLKAKGFHLALDDFRWSPGVDELVEMADYIKVDFLQSDETERRHLLKRLSGYGATLLAEKIETRTEFEQAAREGFQLFQGYYFCRPELMKKREMPANLSAQFSMLRALERDEMDFPAMARLVRQDPAITYRLLRMVNSAAFALRQEVRSVEMALIGVGEENFRRIVLLAIASSLCAGKCQETLRMALVRARFCELAAGNSAEQYLLGLFSLLPVMLQVPMEEAIAKVGLRGPVREALMGAANDEGKWLRWMEYCERGEWEACDGIAQAHALDSCSLHHYAMEALVWTDMALHPVLASRNDRTPQTSSDSVVL